MKKSTNYAPYIYAAFMCTFSAVTNNRIHQHGLALVWIVYFFIFVGLWRLIEWLLNRSDNKWVQWGSVFLVSTLYSFTVIGLDFYAFHLLMNFTKFTAWSFVVNFFLVTVVSAIFIESKRWAIAREKAQIENLNLQAENIEAKFQLLREQVNPEFLFHCLATLKTMARSNDPQTEDYILKLADVYRRILKKGKDVVSLREELAFLQTYMFLMRYGRETALTFEVKVFDESLYYDLPIFALQSLVDNCIKDGEFSENQPLNIRIFQKDAQSITMMHDFPPNKGPLSINAHLEMRYAMEGIENGVLTEKEANTYSTTIKLF